MPDKTVQNSNQIENDLMIPAANSFRTNDQSSKYMPPASQAAVPEDPKMMITQPTNHQNLRFQTLSLIQHHKNAQRHLHVNYYISQKHQKDSVLSFLPNKVVVNLWFTNLIPYLFLILFHLHSSKHQCSSTEIGSQAPVNKIEAFDYFWPPDALFITVHLTEYLLNPKHEPWTLEDLQWYTCPDSPENLYQIVCNGKEIIIYPLIFNRKYNHLSAYLDSMKLPLTPKLTVSTPSPTSYATGQNSLFLGVLYLALTGLIDSALPAAGPWAVAGKTLSYLVKLGPIIWWAMPVPASSPPLPEGAFWYSWYPDTVKKADTISNSGLHVFPSYPKAQIFFHS
ncbi:hypothetical protein DSO57_1007185 [Entomophthora muscae]|uniref:Uncharacterized protein n=1 Tax=Entomophthora muscae TaxID=34485 RepID=A0ACC2SWB3_9FUNG|nr:hypothetical protein DSO57_1007185 [Entomophthora muscae]